MCYEFQIIVIAHSAQQLVNSDFTYKLINATSISSIKGGLHEGCKKTNRSEFRSVYGSI